MSTFIDSALLVGIFSQYRKAKANTELVTEIKRLIREFPNVTFADVRGQNGNGENEFADSPVQAAAKSQSEIRG